MSAIEEECPCGGSYKDEDYEHVLAWRETHAHHVRDGSLKGKNGTESSNQIGFIPDVLPTGSWGYPLRPEVG